MMPLFTDVPKAEPLNAVVKAIDAGHFAHWERVTDGKRAWERATVCVLDGATWPCPEIVTARLTVSRRYGSLRPAAA